MDSDAPFSVAMDAWVGCSKRNVNIEMALRYLDYGFDEYPLWWSQKILLNELGISQVSGEWRLSASLPKYSQFLNMTLVLDMLTPDARAAVSGSFQVFTPGTGNWTVIKNIRTILKTAHSRWEPGFTVGDDTALPYDAIFNDNSEYVKDGVLRLKAEFEFSLEVPSKVVKTSPSPCICPHCKRRGDLFRTKSSTDFVLISSDGREFPVHRFMLASQSNVFAAMLKPGMVEASSGRCGIKDVDGDTLDILVEFLYTSCPGRVAKDAEKVLKAADKYEVVDLVAAAVEHLSANLDVKNAARLYVLATERRLAGLEKAVASFIMSQSDAVAMARVWKEVAQLSDQE